MACSAPMQTRCKASKNPAAVKFYLTDPISLF
jgi:hypothetical protein